MESKSEYCGCLYYSANALARLMTRLAEEEFAKSGLSPSYAFLLMTVNSLPGIQPRELCKHLQLTPSTVTRLIDKLEYQGYVLRKTFGKNTEIHPAEKSLLLDDTLKTLWLNLYKRYSAIIGEKEGRELTEKINSAINKLHE